MRENYKNIDDDIVATQQDAHDEVEAQRMEIAAIRQSFHMGPLSSPEVLERYDAICPGAAGRVIAMAEQQVLHRQSLEKFMIVSQSRNSLLGVVFAFVLAFTAIVGGLYAALMGAQVTGSLIGMSGVVTLAGTFIYGTNSNRQERQENQKTQVINSPAFYFCPKALKFYQ